MALALGQCASLACLLEAAAPKPGNVHRGADFDDLSFTDFLWSAVAIGPVIEAAPRASVGETVLAAVRATRGVVATNTNLGIILLLAPLAKIERGVAISEGIQPVLAALTSDDARLVYEAIRLSQAGGLGRAAESDVADAAPPSLLDAMRAAADRDLIARQYAYGFRTVWDEAANWLRRGLAAQLPLTDAIIDTHIRLMAAHPDSLISRKCGPQIAVESSLRAQQVLDAGWPGDPAYLHGLADLDFWLRSDEHRRNPGTTADLVAAALFAGLRDGWIAPPVSAA